ncbi:MAG: TVP38/TMEM64 family protein [Deltaproteobacteria bacterium]|nr:TVP38/TMEM64 family protein [Deltaproteobacteria bacterium]
MEQRVSEKKLFIKGAILLLLILLIFWGSRFSPQPFGVPDNLWEELEDPSGRQERIRRFFFSLGPYSAAVFVLLQVLQVAAAPIPGELLGLAGGYLYGPGLGFFLSMVGLILGSWIAFELARTVGRPLVEKMVKKEFLKKFDFLGTNAGATICFVLFLIPGPKDYLCYLLGLSHMRLGVFLMMMVFGRIPGTALLTIQGTAIRSQNASTLVFVVAVSVVIVFFAYLYRGRVLAWVKARAAGT